MGNVDSNEPRRVTSRFFAMVSAGRIHTCGLETSFLTSSSVDRPSGPAFCWGDGEDGALGIDPELAQELEEFDEPTFVETVSDFIWISGGSQDTCGIDSNGVAYCWGINFGFTPEPEPSPTNFVSVDSGNGFQCGITSDFLLYCWGDRNNRGQLGLGDLDPRDDPTLVPTEAYRSVSAGRDHACAVTKIDGRVQCWGSNRDGQLGFPATETCGILPCSRSPDDIDSNARFVAVSAGEAHTCALANTGEVFCWGSNEFGELGNGGGGGGPMPVRVNDPQ